MPKLKTLMHRWEDISVGVLKKCGSLWPGLICLRIGTNGGLSWTRRWIFVFHIVRNTPSTIALIILVKTSMEICKPKQICAKIFGIVQMYYERCLWSDTGSFGIVSHDGPGSCRLSCFILLLIFFLAFIVTNIALSFIMSYSLTIGCSLLCGFVLEYLYVCNRHIMEVL